MEDWLRRNEHGIKMLAAAAAAAFTLIQYFGHLGEVRVEKTLGFYERFSSGSIFAARTEVLEAWESLEAQLLQLPAPATSAEMIALRRQWQQLVVAAIKKNPNLTTDTDIMFDFFDALQVCIENDICDKKTAQELMQGAATIFVGNNCPYVAHVRFNQKLANYGAKAATFAGQPCQVDIYR